MVCFKLLISWKDTSVCIFKVLLVRLKYLAYFEIKLCRTFKLRQKIKSVQSLTTRVKYLYFELRYNGTV